MECGERVVTSHQLLDVEGSLIEPGEPGRVVGHIGNLEIVDFDRLEDYVGDRRVAHGLARDFRVVRHQGGSK